MSETNIAYTMKQCGHTNCAPCRMENYEAVEIDYTCDYLDKVVKAGKLNGIFVDIGAHVGLWALQMSEWYQNRYAIKPTIYAVEPDGLNFRMLKRNAEQHDTGIIPIQAAAWHKKSWLFMNHHDNPGRHQVTDVGMHGRQAMRVRGIALDDVCTTEQSRQVDVIKIDVEGAELNVLNGARRILMANEHLLVIVEYSLGHFAQYGYKASQITGFMREHGFEPARPVDQQTVKTIKAGELKRVIFTKGKLG